MVDFERMFLQINLTHFLLKNFGIKYLIFIQNNRFISGNNIGFLFFGYTKLVQKNYH